MRGDVPQRVRGALARVSSAVGLPLLWTVGHPGLAAAAPWPGCCSPVDWLLQPRRLAAIWLEGVGFWARGVLWTEHSLKRETT